MTLRRGKCDPEDDVRRVGIGGFLRSLLAGVPWSERAEGKEILNLPAPASGTLSIHNANGRTRVIGEDRRDIEVRAQKTARAESVEAAEQLLEEIQLLHTETGSTLELEVEMPRKWNRRGHVHLELRVPSGTSTDILSSNGKICVENLRAGVRARSSNGSVDVTDVVGDVEIATSNAKICCAGTCGRLIARSSNGKIEVDEHSGSLDASTSNGLIRACMERLGSDGVLLATSNGRIVLELPEKVDAEVDIRVDNGVIRNDRPLCKAIRERSGQLRGRMGSGGAPIKLRTSNGSICLR